MITIGSNTKIKNSIIGSNQKEIERLRKELKLAEENEEYWHNAFSDLEDEYAGLKDRINRAIGYLETGKTFDNREIGAVVNYLQECLLNILKGE